jgi:hypothetical protein
MLLIVPDTKMLFLVKICPQFEDENLSQKFSAEMKFGKIDPL